MGRTQGHSKLRVVVTLTVCLKLWLPLEENKCGPIFRRVLVTIDLVKTRHKSIQLANNTIQNPAILFFDIFLLLRSTQEVTTGNLSLNKWKTWPVEFFEDCEKYEKKFRRWKLKFRGQFGDSKIVERTHGRNRQMQNFFLIDFDIWNVKIGVCMQKLWLFYEQTPN